MRAACDERGDALTVVLLNARLEAYAARADADPALATYFDAFEVTQISRDIYIYIYMMAQRARRYRLFSTQVQLP